MLLSGGISGVMLAVVLLTLHRSGMTSDSPGNASAVESRQQANFPANPVESQLGPRHQLSYEQWVKILEREAAVVAETRPHPLFILAGDSLSLWFPSNLLPPGVTWLNQGISGETSYGLLRRVKLLDQTQPEIIFVLIGINDLLRGVRRETLLANQREIVRHFKKMHPNTRIVVQSILPSDRLQHLSNQDLRKFNQRLAAMAKEEGAEYLDLHGDFVDSSGNLHPALTTDGLHLSIEGYKVWRSQLQQYASAQINSEVLPNKPPPSPPLF